VNPNTGEVFMKLDDNSNQIPIESSFSFDKDELVTYENFFKDNKTFKEMDCFKMLNTIYASEHKKKMQSPSNFTKIPSSKSSSNYSAFNSNITGPKKKKKRNKKTGCNCSKSKCLRLHCVCFRDGIFCGKDCGCKGCFNNTKNTALVMKVRDTTKDINSSAFKNRIIKIKLNGEVLKFTHGCSCSKNNCQKNYCECKKNGLPCSPLCKCDNCKNCKVNINPDIANSLLRKVSRKKKKIIFKLKNKDSIEVIEKVLAKKQGKNKSVFTL
jgi:hypothetical protein